MGSEDRFSRLKLKPASPDTALPCARFVRAYVNLVTRMPMTWTKMPILMLMLSTGVHFQFLIISFCSAATLVSAKCLSKRAG